MIVKMRPNNRTKQQAGLTLIEVTLVIAVLLGLISILFIGVSAYKKGSDRAKCIIIQSTVQKAVRSYQNLYEKNIGDLMRLNMVAGPGLMIETYPSCPSGGIYNSSDEKIPPAGTRFLYCSITEHVPSSTDSW